RSGQLLGRSRRVPLDDDALAAGPSGAGAQARMTADRIPAGAPLRRLIETVVRRLSEHPAEARVVEMSEGRGTLYEIYVPVGDRGRLMGREGRRVRAGRGRGGPRGAASRAFGAPPPAARGKKVTIRIRD